MLHRQQPSHNNRFNETPVIQRPGKAAQKGSISDRDLDRQCKADLDRDCIFVMTGLEQPGFVSAWGLVENCPSCGELTACPYVIGLSGVEPQSLTECGRCDAEIVCESRTGKMTVLAAGGVL